MVSVVEAVWSWLLLMLTVWPFGDRGGLRWLVVRGGAGRSLHHPSRPARRTGWSGARSGVGVRVRGAGVVVEELLVGGGRLVDAAVDGDRGVAAGLRAREGAGAPPAGDDAGAGEEDGVGEEGEHHRGQDGGGRAVGGELVGDVGGDGQAEDGGDRLPGSARAHWGVSSC